MRQRRKQPSKPGSAQEPQQKTKKQGVQNPKGKARDPHKPNVKTAPHQARRKNNKKQRSNQGAHAGTKRSNPPTGATLRARTNKSNGKAHGNTKQKSKCARDGDANAGEKSGSRTLWVYMLGVYSSSGTDSGPETALTCPRNHIEDPIMQTLFGEYYFCTWAP